MQISPEVHISMVNATPNNNIWSFFADPNFCSWLGLGGREMPIEVN